MTAESQAESSTELLDQIVRLLGLLVVRTMPEGSTQTDRILILHSAGLSTPTIVELTGAAPQTVANRLSEAKKKRLAKDAK